MNQYTPDRWVVLRFTPIGEEPIDKVFAGWHGGYLSGDAWKLSSGIVSTKETKTCFKFINHSGSEYICYKNRHGMNYYMSGLLEDWKEQAALVTIEVLP